jgi:hypothetical protein
MDTAKASSAAAVRHDAMLEALAFAAQRFLEQPSWVQSIDGILGRLVCRGRDRGLGLSEPRFGQPTAGQAATTGWSTLLGPTWAAPPGDPMPLMVSLNHSALIGVNCFHSAGTSSS